MGKSNNFRPKYFTGKTDDKRHQNISRAYYWFAYPRLDGSPNSVKLPPIVKRIFTSRIFIFTGLPLGWASFSANEEFCKDHVETPCKVRPRWMDFKNRWPKSWLSSFLYCSPPGLKICVNTAKNRTLVNMPKSPCQIHESTAAIPFQLYHPNTASSRSPA